MQRVTLNEFLASARPYDEWRAPLDTNLRNAAILAGVAALVSPILLFVLPPFGSLGDTWFFFLLGKQFTGLLLLLEPLRLWLCILDGIVLVGVMLVTSETEGLEYATVGWHQVAFVFAVVGAINPLVIGILGGLALFIALMNLAVWMFLLGMFAAFVFVVACITRPRMPKLVAKMRANPSPPPPSEVVLRRGRTLRRF